MRVLWAAKMGMDRRKNRGTDGRKPGNAAAIRL